MNPKNTWLWIGVAAGLFVLVFLHQRHASKADSGPIRVLPNLKAAAVTSIQVTPGVRTHHIRVERTNGVWQLTKVQGNTPLVYPAQALSIESLLSQLQRLTPAPYITARELRNQPKVDEAYGFVAPQASIVIEQPDHPARLLVGARTAPGDQVFLKVVGADGIYVVSADLLNYIPRTPEDWRDTTLIELKGLAFDRLSVTNGAKIFELRRNATNKLWRMVYPLQARAYSARVEESLQLLQSVTIDRFVSDDPKADLEAFGLQSPELELAFGQGTNTVARLQFGKSLAITNDTRLVYARRVGRNTIVAVPKDLLAPWYALVNDFRDPLLVTLTAPVAVVNVNVRGQDGFSVQEQTNGTWRIVPQGFPADAGLVKDLLSALSAMQITEFRADNAIAQEWPRYGLASPARQYALKSATTNSPAGPTNGLITELNFGTNEADKVFVRCADEPGFVYAVKLADFERLPSASWQLRERRVWDLSTNDVARVTIRQQGKVCQIIRNGPYEWSLTPGITNDLAVEETVSGLCQLTAVAWAGRGAADRARYGFTDNSRQITLELKNGEKRSVEFSSGPSSSVPCAAVMLDGEPWVFECPAWLYGYVQRYLSPPLGP